jgi:hypothetical protein
MRRRQRAATSLAAGLLVLAPTIAFWAAPATATSPGAAPGSELAGINADATATGIQVALLTPGIVPLGNSAVGDVVDISAPYANSTVGTGPTTAGIATPAWPGSALASAGSLAETFSSNFPHALAKLLNDPVLARSTYPPQLNVKRSGKFAPAGADQAGVGTSTTSAGPAGTSAHSQLTDLPLGMALPGIGKSAAGPLIEVGSTTVSSVAHVRAASVSTAATTRVGTVTVAGVVKIAGISSDAFTSSDGKRGSRSSDLRIGAVTVAGVPASIGPRGITLARKDLTSNAGLIPIANAVLTALKVAGVTIRTIAPAGQVTGSAATVTSGAVQIAFQDNHVPNLGALLPQLPLLLPNSLGVHVNLGLSQADADTTLLPGLGQPLPVTPPVTSGTPPAAPPAAGSINPPAGGVGLPPAGSTGAPAPGATPVIASPVTRTAFGVPVRVAWVVGAFLLALLAAGPLLAYANWQLLGGRTS